ncbi:unnamed protein product [Ixodes hexagonus]
MLNRKRKNTGDAAIKDNHNGDVKESTSEKRPKGDDEVPFTVIKFVRDLEKEGNPVEEVGRFVKAADSFTNGESATDVVKQYLNLSNGNFQDIAALIGNQKSGSVALVPLYHCLERILSRVAEHFPHFGARALLSVQQVLQRHGRLVQHSLSRRAKANHVKAALRMLTAMVTLGPEGARYVTSVVNFEGGDFSTCLSWRNRKVRLFRRSTRLLSWSRRGGRMRAYAKEHGRIVSGSAASSCLGVRLKSGNLHHKLVVESMSVTKTTKVKMLNDKSLKPVVQLLIWEGPRQWKPGKWNKFAPAEEQEDDETRAVLQGSKEDAEMVQSTAYEFLVSLCCSHKHGILFRDSTFGQSNKNVNHVITAVLQSMEQPYEHPRCSAFVVEVLRVSPDQIAHYLHSWEPIMAYSTVATTEKLIKLLTQAGKHLIIFVEVQDIESYLRTSAEKSPEKICKLASYLSLLSLVQRAGEAQSLQGENADVPLHLAHMHFVAASLRKMRAALDFARDPKSSLSGVPKEKLELLLCQENVPPTDELVSQYRETVDAAVQDASALKGSGKRQISMKVVLRGSYCQSILDVLALYKEYATGDQNEFDWKLVAGIGGIQTDSLDSAVGECLQLRAIGLVLDACSSTEALLFGVNQSPFSHLLELLSRCTEDTVGRSASSLITNLLCKVNVLEDYGWEVGIWMEKLRQGQHLELVRLLLESVKLVLSDPNGLNGEVMQCVTAHGVAGGAAGLNLRDILQRTEEALGDLKEMESFQAGKYFSPLLPAVLKIFAGSSDPLCKLYVHAVIKDILHYQQQPQALCKFLNERSALLSKSLRRYVSIWSGGAIPQKRPQKDKAAGVFCPPAAEELEDVFLDHLFVRKEIKSATLRPIVEDVASCDMSQCKALFYQVLFYVKACFDNTELLGGVRPFLKVFGKLFEQCLQLDGGQESCLAFLDVLLRHETTLSWYLREGVEDASASGAMLDYSCFLLDMITLSLQKTSSIPSKLEVSLRYLKDRCVRATVNQSLPKGLDCTKLVAAFAPVLSEADIVTLLEAVVQSTSRQLRKSIEQLLCASFARSGSDSVESTPLLPATIISRILSCLLKCKNRELVEQDGKPFLSSFMRFLEHRPIYMLALKEDDLTQLLGDKASPAHLDMLTLLMKHSVLHRQHLQQLVQSHRPTTSHLPTASVASFLRALITGLTREEQSHKLGLWLAKTFRTLLKRCLEEELSPDAITDIRCTLASLIELGFLCKENILTLLEMLNETPARQLQLALLNTLCSRVSQSLEDPAIQDACLHRFLQCLAAALEAEGGQVSQAILEEVQASVAVVKAINQDLFARVVRQDGLWPQFVKSCLRSGFQSSTFGGVSFELLSAICQKVYGTENVGDINPAVCRVHMMMFGHSKFLSLILDASAEAQPTKDKMLELMVTLVQCDKSVCQVEHIPVFLSAYGGTLSMVDQRLLYLMFLYERSGVDMCSFRPFMWGPSAVSFYSIHKKVSVSLLKQPKTEEILSLLDEDKMAASVLRFPLTLDLQVSPSDAVADENLYDPRFLLPLLYTMLSPGSLVNCHKLVEMRCLAFLLASLSSEVFQVRCLGCNVLMLFHQQLQGSRFSSSEFWLCVLESLRNAVTVTCVRMPCLVTGYLASAADVVGSPENDMFNPILNYLLAKPVLDIGNMPDFYKMFYNPTVQHNFRRSWFLEVMANYMRCSLDFHICKKRYIFNILLTYFMSPLCHRQSKVLVLRILTAAVKIPKAARILCREHGLLAWISAALSRNADNESVAKLLLGVLHHLWGSSAIKTVRLMDLKAARMKETAEMRASSQTHRAAKESDDDNDDEEDSGSVQEMRDPDSEVTPKRFYQHFPFEYLLTLFSVRKHVRSCMDLSALNQFTADLRDALEFVRTQEKSGENVVENLCLPDENLVSELIGHWDYFAARSSDGGKECDAAAQAIAQVCHHWPPNKSTPAVTWAQTLGFVLSHAEDSVACNLATLSWVRRWIDGVEGQERSAELVEAGKTWRLEKLLGRVYRTLGELATGGGDEEAASVALGVLEVLFGLAMASLLPKEQRKPYRKELAHLRALQVSGTDKAMACTRLFHELLLRVIKGPQTCT